MNIRTLRNSPAAVVLADNTYPQAVVRSLAVVDNSRPAEDSLVVGID